MLATAFEPLSNRCNFTAKTLAFFACVGSVFAVSERSRKWAQGSLAVEQLPALGSSWFIAELFYKFGSFSLECAAFLPTSFVFDAAVQGLLHMLGARTSAP